VGGRFQLSLEGKEYIVRFRNEDLPSLIGEPVKLYGIDTTDPYIGVKVGGLVLKLFGSEC